MKTITITNQKGGVGKTTTVHHLAVALREAGERVLVVDLDPQAHATVALRGDASRGSAYALLTSAARATDVIVSQSGIDLIPSEQHLARFENEAGTDDANVLSDAILSVVDSYDWCLIDTPPSLGALSTNALLAADGGVLVPLCPEPLALKGLQLLLTTVGELRDLNPELHVCGIVPTMVQSRWATHTSVLDVIPHLLAGIPVLESIPLHGSFVRASAKRCSIFEVAPRSTGAAAYRSLAECIVKQVAAGVAA